MTQRFHIGPFELHDIIGRGGMGEVWSGVHVAEGEPVAVKVLTQEGARRQEYVEGFHNEVRAVAGLNHPHIVTPLDYGEISERQARDSAGKLLAGSPYIVMELALRGTLRKYQEAMRWPQVKSALLVILDALAHAHAAGIVHRDLKPANILVGCPGPEPGIKLTDFGLARLSHSFDREGSQEAGWGTPHYMAPEQFRGHWRDYGPWTDLYAVGVMAFELVDGNLPFMADSAMGFAKAHSMDAPKAFQPRFSVPAGFDAWLTRLLQKDPEDRFVTAADAAHALLQLRDTAPIGDARTIPEVVVVPTSVTAQMHFADDSIEDRTATTQLLDGPRTQNENIDFDELAAVPKSGTPMPVRLPPMPATWRRKDEDTTHRQLLGAGLGLFGLRSIPLVGREHERDVLWQKLRQVREQRQLQVVVVRGPAGTGKSRLAEWIARRAHETGAANVMHASHSGMGTPSDGIGRMLGRYTRCLGLRREEIVSRASSYLRKHANASDVDPRAFADFIAPSGPEVALASGITQIIARTDQRYGLVRKFLEVGPGERPFVVVLDDVQWGSDALMFTQYLLDRADAQNVPALLILTVREESLAFRETEEAMLQQLQARERVTTLHLQALNADEIDRLVRKLLYLDGELADEIEDRSGGNPLFAVQMVGELVSRGKLQFGPRGFILKDQEKLEIPDDIHALWRSRVFRLVAARPANDLVALEIAAALGNDIEREEWNLACTLAQITPPHDLIGALQAEGLAEHRDEGWAFSHGLLRESIQRDAEIEGRWEAVNAAAVEMLFRRYPRREFPFHDRIAEHLQRASEIDASLIHRIEAAHTRAERCEFDEAKRHLKTFWAESRNLGMPANDPRRGKALIAEATLHLQQGHLAEALRQAENAAIEARKHRWDCLPLAQITQAECHLARLQLDKAAQMFERALENLSEHPRVTARASLGLGRVRAAQGAYDAAIALTESAQQIFREQNDLVGQARSLNTLGDIMRETRRYREARDFSRNAMQLFEKIGHLIGVADCQNDLADLYRAEGHTARGIQWCVKAIQLFESLGSDESMAARITLGLLLRDGKRPQEALSVFAQVAAHHRATRNPQAFAITVIHAVSCHAMLGQWEDVTELLNSAAEPLRALKVAPYHAGVSAHLTQQLASSSSRTAQIAALNSFVKQHEKHHW